MGFGTNGGKRAGRPSKETILQRDLAELGSDLRKAPKSLLLQHMLFWDQKFEQAKACIARLEPKEAKFIEPEEMTILVRARSMLEEASERVVEIANAAAQFYHPKLAAVQVQAEVEHKFVLRAPEVIEDSQEWLNEATKLIEGNLQ